MADITSSSRLQRELIKITDMAGPRVSALGKPAARSAIPPSTGSSPVAYPSGGGGIASPLTEQSRTYHATKVTSSDGLFVWSVPDVVSMTDANAQVVEFHYLAPP